MKKNNLVKTIGSMFVLGTLIVSSGVMGFADSNYKTPGEIFSKLTNTTVEEAYESKGEKTFGELAQEKGILDEFRKENLDNRKAYLEEKVKNGSITQEQADLILENMENCDGTLGQKKLGQGYHLKFGNGNGMGNGNKGGFGKGMNRKN